MLLPAHSANLIILTFVIVSHEIFLVRLFCAKERLEIDGQ